MRVRLSSQPPLLIARGLIPQTLTGNIVSLRVGCAGAADCHALCSGAHLVMDDVTVPISCDHAANLAERVREAIDATILGSISMKAGKMVQ